MMPLFKQECPICEFVFEIDEDDIEVSKSIRCSCCGHLFSSQQISQVARTSKTAALPQSREKNQTEADSSASVAIGKSDDLRSSILIKRMQSKRRSNFLLLLLFLGAIASVGYLVYRFNDLEQQRQQQLADLDFKATETTKSNEATQLIDPSPPNATPVSPAPLPTQTISNEDAEIAPVITTPVKSVSPPKFQYIPAATAADQAALTRPYLVLLEIESPTGTTYATGTIVDSRGYVATSLRAVEGATKIKVSSAQITSQIKRNATPTLSDNVRSVLAVSRSQQWVLLEINRRLVLNANDIVVPSADRIVSRQPLLRIIAPQLPSDYAVSEMRVDSRKKYKDLTIKEKQLLYPFAGEVDKEVKWILSPSSPYDRAGAVLISPTGKLMAMLVNSDDRFSFYVSGSEIAKRLRENNFDTKSLSDLVPIQ